MHPMLTITAALELELERTALGRRASMSLEGPAPRIFHGVVTRVALDEAHEHHGKALDRSGRYRVVFEPRFALLQRIVRTLFFQSLSVVDVAEEVLRQHGIGVETRLGRQHPAPAHPSNVCRGVLP